MDDLDRAWLAELDGYCGRCDQPWHKCDCADQELDALDEWLNREAYSGDASFADGDR